MAHHGGEGLPPSFFQNTDQINKALNNAANRTSPLGPTGKFPEGKLTETDEGEIQIGIGNVPGKVVMEFGKPIAWIGFTPEQARQVAQSLIEKAEAAEKEG